MADIAPDYCPDHRLGVCHPGRYGHDCALPDAHYGPHECFCGHQWTEP